MRNVRVVFAVAAVIAAMFALQAVHRSSPDSAVVATPTLGVTQAASQQASVNDKRRVPDPEAEASQHTGKTEVCGLGWVTTETDGAEEDALNHQVVALAKQGRHEIARRLLSDPNPFSQASGLVVNYLSETDDFRLSAGAQGPSEACEGADCPEFKASVLAKAQLADGLARLASQTLDARVYALAMPMCYYAASWQQPANACLLLSERQWSQIDPHNGVPWLNTLRDQSSNNSVDEALFQIAKAARYDDGYFAVAGEIARHARADDRLALGAFAASTEAVGMSAAIPVPLNQLLAACRGAALSDSNRRQLCEGVADTLFHQSSSLMMASIGLKIGRNLGWDPSRADALRGLLIALGEAQFTQASSKAASDPSCSNYRHLNQGLERRAVVGELGWAREWLAANGKTEEEYTRKAREGRLRSETAKQAPSPASATSAPG